VYKLFSVDSGFKEPPNLFRISTSVVVVAESKGEAIQFAQQKYPEVFSEGTECLVMEVNHVTIRWDKGEVAVIDQKHSKQFHC
jgi:hypothetical protein